VASSVTEPLSVVFSRVFPSLERDLGELLIKERSGWSAGLPPRQPAPSPQPPPPGGGAPTGSPSPATLTLAQALAAIRAPDTILEVMLAAQETGYVQDWFHRLQSDVPAGTVQTFVDNTPPGWQTFIVAYRTAVDPASAAVRITTSLDSESPFASDVPMPGDWNLRGAFLSPVSNAVTFTVEGDPDQDVSFVREFQAALVNVDHYRLVIRPLLRQWFMALSASQRVSY